MSNLQKRILTGIFGVLLLILIIYKGSSYIKVALFILSLECIRELYNGFLKIDVKLNLASLFFGAILSFLLSYYNFNLMYSVLVFFFVNGVFAVVEESFDLRDNIYTIFSYFYGVFLINLLGNIPDTFLIILAFIISFSTDTFAFIVGSIFGKRKLIERISPKKTVEGAIGGTVLGSLASIIYMLYIKYNYYNFDFGPFLISLIIFASIGGQFGDLFASKIKRYIDIKDFSNILPGHGGILDRFDSLNFVAIFVHIISFVIGVS